MPCPLGLGFLIMPCTFPAYSDISGAQIIAAISPRDSLGSFTAKVIDKEKADFAENSIIGLAVQSFNDWFTAAGIDISAVSNEDCTKSQHALKLYIAGKYLEQDKILNDCPDGERGEEKQPYSDVKYLYNQACDILSNSGANITGVADFCTYGNNEVGDTWGSERFDHCKPSDENFIRGLPPHLKGKETFKHSDLDKLENDDHPQYLTVARGNSYYYTQAQIDSKLIGLTGDHGSLLGLSDDDHPQYHNDSRGDARYYTQSQIDASLLLKADISSLATVATSGNYSDLAGLPTIPAITDDISEGTNLYFTNERVDDRVSNLLVAGTNITLTYDDVANSLTVDAAGGGAGISFIEISGGSFTHGFSEAGNTYLVRPGWGTTTITLSDNQGNEAFFIEYRVTQQASMTIAGNNLVGRKRNFEYGESVRVEYIPDNLGSNNDGEWIIVSDAIGDLTSFYNQQYDVPYNMEVGRNDGFGSTSISIRSPGIGNTSSILLGADSDNAGIFVTSYESDKMEFAFRIEDNPESQDDFFVWKAIHWRAERWLDVQYLRFGGYDARINANNFNINAKLAINNGARYWGGGSGDGRGASVVTDADETGGKIGEIGYNTNAGTTGDFEVDISGFSNINPTDFRWTILAGLTTYELKASGYATVNLAKVDGSWITHASGLKYRFIAGTFFEGDRYGIKAFSSQACTFSGDVEISGDIKAVGGTITLAEITTPSAEANFGKIYTKSNNKLYFQTGAGTEREIQFV